MPDQAEDKNLPRGPKRGAELTVGSSQSRSLIDAQIQTARLRSENEELQRQLNDIKRSSSWKITAPFRKILAQRSGIGHALSRSVSVLRGQRGGGNAPAHASELAPPTEQARSAEIEILPVQDVAFVAVDLHLGDPVEATMQSPEFAACVNFFANSPSAKRALMSPHSQALLHSIVRNQKPSCAVEIGTYKASTTEAICRALQANGSGILHTVDPYGAATVPAILARWPDELHQHVSYCDLNSMGFFAGFLEAGSRAELIFIDGNHDYEFALFDIQCAARVITRGGYLFVDNISQAGPFFAARDFLAMNPAWQPLGQSLKRYRPGTAFDYNRTTIVNTDFCVLQAPALIHVTSRPLTFGQVPWIGEVASAVELSVATPATGTLHVQCVLRELGDVMTERVAAQSVELRTTSGTVTVPLAEPVVRLSQGRGTVEFWLTWDHQEPLTLTMQPSLVCTPVSSRKQ
jgi:predicted O-methyltransferase YrrM